MQLMRRYQCVLREVRRVSGRKIIPAPSGVISVFMLSPFKQLHADFGSVGVGISLLQVSVIVIFGSSNAV